MEVMGMVEFDKVPFKCVNFGPFPAVASIDWLQHVVPSGWFGHSLFLHNDTKEQKSSLCQIVLKQTRGYEVQFT